MRQQAENAANDPWAVLAVIALTCVGASMFQVLPLFLGAAADHLGFTTSEIGLLGGFELAGATLGSVAAVFWIRHLDWRKASVFALLAVAAGNLGSTLADGFFSLSIVRFVTGCLGAGSVYALTLAVIRDMQHPERVFGLAIAAQVGLTVVAMLVLPTWIARFGISGVLYPLAAMTVLVVPAVRKLPRQAKTPKLDSTAGFSSRAPVFVALAAQVVWYLGVGAIWAFVERMGIASGFSLAMVGKALAISTAIGMLGALSAALVGARWGRLPMYAAAILLQIAAVFVLPDVSSWLVFTAAVAMFQFAWNYALPYMLGAIAANDASGRYTVLIIAAQGTGVAVGPIAAGVLVQGGDLSAVACFGMLACAASLVLFAVLAWRWPRPPASQA